MAEEEVQEQETEEAAAEEPPKSKKKLFLGGGFVAVIAAGAMAAVMALPKTEAPKTLAGPFTIPLFPELFNCNLQEQGRTRYLQMKPQATYFTYDPEYMKVRVTDELYRAEVQSTVFKIASRKSLNEIYGEVNESTFMEEIRDALAPVLFPVHIGETRLPWDVDPESGLRPGLSSDKNSFRGLFHEHVLHVGPEQEMWIDDGPRTSFEGGEFDVRIVTSKGDVVFVDVSGMKPEFTGEIRIGVQGKIMRILPVDLLVQ